MLLQVFLEFAREQDEDRTGDKNGQVEAIPPINSPEMV